MEDAEIDNNDDEQIESTTLDDEEEHESSFSWTAELSGSVGDLGSFVPLFISLCVSGHIEANSALLWAGVANVVTGTLFQIPLPVQPMKAIAVAALTNQLEGSGQVRVAGFSMGVLVLLASLCIETIHKYIPKSIVAGIQAGVGVHLSITALSRMAELPVWGVDCILLAVLVFPLCILLLQRRHPVGLYMMGSGVVVVLLQLIFDKNAALPKFHWEPIVRWDIPRSAHSWQTGLVQGALPQLPLTLLNSVVSVCCLADDLYPERRKTSGNNDNESSVLSKRAVCYSIGLLNIVLSLCGGLPVCHGAGGLAGQHRFGARRGTSVVFLGSVKVVLALALGNWLLAILQAIPIAILGNLLLLAGHELVLTGFKHLETNHDRVVVAYTLIGILGLQKTYYGLLLGGVAHLLRQSQPRVAMYHLVHGNDSTVEDGVQLSDS